MLQRSRLTTIICTTLIVVCFTAGVGMAQSGGCTWGSSDYSWSAHFGGSRAADIASAKGGDVYLYISTNLDFILQTWTVTDAWGASGYTWVADFNGDGKADIASATVSKVYIFDGDGKAYMASAKGDKVYMHLSQGNSFSSSAWLVPDEWGGSGYTWAADFNGDGKADIASAKAGWVSMFVSRGNSFSGSA